METPLCQSKYVIPVPVKCKKYKVVVIIVYLSAYNIQKKF